MRSRQPTRLARLLAAAAVVSVVSGACGDHSPTAPVRTTDAAATASRFEHLADSLAAVGDDENASVARGMADLVRTVGRVDEVVVTVDGRSVTHAAIAMELLVAASACDASSDPEFCRLYNPPFMQLVLGWSDLDMREGFSLTTDQPGTTSLSWEGSPDPFSFADVLYFKRDSRAEPDGPFGMSARAWIADRGTVTTPAGVRGADCQTAGDLQPGASFACHQAAFSPSFDVTASELTFDEVATPPSVHITMAPQRVDGLSLDVSGLSDAAALSVGRGGAAAHRRSAATVARMRGLLWRVSPRFLSATTTTRARGH